MKWLTPKIPALSVAFDQDVGTGTGASHGSGEPRPLSGHAYEESLLGRDIAV
ncbi:hypothetical protein F4559_004202 [Saccharothrix violaceirubra]|uniref:Uncharacterized protein n=1 Tax=Saccharothrix violaceirubra TaxID=413306 RepID=A0A7W7WXP1_9PSEU|nr:hypothetical protein [Saccharothrix violaceirubra]